MPVIAGDPMLFISKLLDESKIEGFTILDSSKQHMYVNAKLRYYHSLDKMLSIWIKRIVVPFYLALVIECNWKRKNTHFWW